MLRSIHADGTSIETAILSTLCYFDVFSFAPNPSEIHRFLMGHRCSLDAVTTALRDSQSLAGALGTRDGLWFLRGKDHLALRRHRFALHSERLWPRARRLARTIERSRLAICGVVTGSLAANNADEHADIDFLFIYPAARTWTSFAAMRLAAKLPLTDWKSICPNYVLSADRLEIRPQNLFTAWEIAKVIPLFGFNVFESFIRANAWVRRYLPNALPLLDGTPNQFAGSEQDSPWLTQVTDNPLFQRLEKLEQRRKFQKDKRDVGVDMDARRRRGSMDRHSPTRSFHTLSELRFRMESRGLNGHPLFGEILAATTLLGDEMKQFGDEAVRAAELRVVGNEER